MNDRLVSFMNNISLTERAQATVRDFCPAAERLEEMSARFFHGDRDGLIEEVRAGENSAQLFLSLFTHLALEVSEKMRKEGVSERIITDTFSDIAIWNAAYLSECGTCGLGEVDWLTNHLLNKLFRIGRLQYGPERAWRAFSVHGREVAAGEDIFYMHIPRGAPLTMSECTASYNDALAFFRRESMVIMCDSWMLSPRLDALLRQGSNIAAFKAQFEILSVDESNRSAERYIFGSIGRVQHYPQDTPFRKLVKQALLSANAPLGAALGAFIIPLKNDD